MEHLKEYRSNLINLDIRGIKCDHCPWRDDDAPRPPHSYVAYLGRPCPDCGANLLTFECFQNMQKLIRQINRFNSVFRPLGWVLSLFSKGRVRIPFSTGETGAPLKQCGPVSYETEPPRFGDGRGSLIQSGDTITQNRAAPAPFVEP